MKSTAVPIAEQDEKVFKWPWMQTFTGKAFIAKEPDPAAIDPLDICIALSREARYNGHTKHQHAYSVAQHSVLMAERFLFNAHEEPKIKRVSLARWALMHDAAEAYCKDLTWSVKTLLPEYKAIEAVIEEAIAERFGLVWPRPPEIKHYDNRMLATEARDIMASPPRDWQQMPEPFRTMVIRPWPAFQAMTSFARLYDHLFLSPGVVPLLKRLDDVFEGRGRCK